MRIAFVFCIMFFLLMSCGTTPARTVPEHGTIPGQEYIPPTVEDTPLFQRYKALVEADGFPYSHYETGIGLAVHGRINYPGGGWSGKSWGRANEGITRIPGGDSNKAYVVTWDQYFKAFSDMHKFCFENETVRSIKKAVDQIVLETDYDYPQLFRTPAGTQWVFHPDVKYKSVCDGYANMVADRVSGIPGVEKVLKISSRIGNHAWNEILLSDGRVLYCDATWYDTNSYNVDPKTGNYIIEHEPWYFPTMLTFDKELFSLGGTHYAWGDASQ